MPEESKNATFYQKHGFTLMADGVAMQTVNPDWRRDRYRHQQGYALIQHNNVVGGTAHRVTLQPHSSIFLSAFRHCIRIRSLQLNPIVVLVPTVIYLGILDPGTNPVLSDPLHVEQRRTALNLQKIG